MGKSDKSYKWFVRADVSKEAGIAIAGIINTWIDLKTLLMASHNGDKGDNPHIHFVMELTSLLQKQAIDTRLKKIIDVNKKSDYSSKVWDGADEACSYLFHEETACILFNKGFTEEDIQKFKTINASFQKVIAVNKEKASNRWPDKAYEHFEGKNPSRYEVLMFFTKAIRRGDMYECGDGNMARYIEEVVLRCTEEEDLEWYVNNRLKRLFRD
jgi:hypothetical protein